MGGLELGVEDPNSDPGDPLHQLFHVKTSICCQLVTAASFERDVKQFTCTLSKKKYNLNPQNFVCVGAGNPNHGLHAHPVQLLDTTAWKGQKVLNSHHPHDVCPVSELWSCHLDLNKIKLFFAF